MAWQDGMVWLVGGVFLGWAGNWLFERSFRRPEAPVALLATPPAPEPAPLQPFVEHIGNEVARLDRTLDERNNEVARLGRMVELLDQQVMTLRLARTGIAQPDTTN